MKKNEIIIDVIKQHMEECDRKFNMFIDKQLEYEDENNLDMVAKYHQYATRQLTKRDTLKAVLVALNKEYGFNIEL